MLKNLLAVFAVFGLVASGSPVWATDFFDNGDGTVTDQDTSLVWQQDDIRFKTWEAALSYCEDLDLAGFQDWRLPNIKELGSIVERASHDPAIDQSYIHITYTQGRCWSSTTFANTPEDAWYVDFFNGAIYRYGKIFDADVRCVRGGP